MKWGNKKVLVTGAGGVIGSHLMEHLMEMGAKSRLRYDTTPGMIRVSWRSCPLPQRDALK